MGMILVIGIIVAGVIVLLGRPKKKPFLESLTNKHVLVTGGSSGIGYAIAKKALIEGAFVTIAARNTAKLAAAKESLIKECVCSSTQILTKELDVGDFSATKKVIDEAFEWRPIDVLVCNAGLARAGLFGECSVQDIDAVVRTNLLGCVYSVHAAIPLMKKRSNSNNPMSIALVGSLAGMYVLYGANVYTATKYALRGLAEILRLELLPYNIRVSLICPGFTDTPLLGDATNEQLLETTKAVCGYDPKDVESPDSVASKMIHAIKNGEYLVVTRKVGAALAMLSRGLIPSESLLTTVLECVFFVPARLFSLLVFLNVKRVVVKVKSS